MCRTMFEYIKLLGARIQMNRTKMPKWKTFNQCHFWSIIIRCRLVFGRFFLQSMKHSELV